MPRWVDTRQGDEEEMEEESTSEEEDDDVEEEVEEEEDEAEEENDADQDDRTASNAQAGPSGQREKITISLGKKGLVCHVGALHPLCCPVQGVALMYLHARIVLRMSEAYIRLSISAPHNKVCDFLQVCGKKGHCAGFVGSVYHDCPFKPCYLCKQSGHTTMTCPFRIAPEHGCRQASGICSDGMLAFVRQRELSGR